MESRGQLDAANQLETGLARRLVGALVAGERVVVADRQRFQTGGDGFLDQLRRAGSAVGLIRVRMQIDQNETNPASFQFSPGTPGAFRPLSSARPPGRATRLFRSE